MVSCVINISKYIFALLMIIYAAASYRAAGIDDGIRKTKWIIFLQFIIFINLSLGNGLLFLAYNDANYFTLYVVELLFLIVFTALYSIIYKNASRLLVNNICLLMSIGFIMIGRLDYDKCVKQLIIAIIGSAITFVIPALLKRIKLAENLCFLYAIISLILLAAVLFGSKVFGANLSITIGTISIQPAEFAKILFVLFIASAFNKSQSMKQIVIVTVISALHVIILVLAKDLGAALIFFFAYLILLYLASGRILLTGAGLLAGAASACLAYKLFAHVRQRVEIWLDPWTDIDGDGYQICQSLFAIGMGSWFGSGLTLGLPDKIPVAEKDFMFSAITEEFGLIFSLSIILICLNNLILIMKIANRCQQIFYKLLAAGFGVIYGFQIFLTIAGTTKLIPMTGVTLPLVSYGGSSLLSTLIGFALVNGIYNMQPLKTDEIMNTDDT